MEVRQLPGLTPEWEPLGGQGGGEGEGGAVGQAGQGEEAVGKPAAAGVEGVLG